MEVCVCPGGGGGVFRGNWPLWRGEGQPAFYKKKASILSFYAASGRSELISYRGRG